LGWKSNRVTGIAADPIRSKRTNAIKTMNNSKRKLIKWMDTYLPVRFDLCSSRHLFPHPAHSHLIFYGLRLEMLRKEGSLASLGCNACMETG
jgi:hypothetical protein